MSLARVLALGSVCLLALAGCREEPECNERTVGATTEVVVQCSTGKVPACGPIQSATDEMEGIYHPMTGQLLRTPTPELSADGSCPAGLADCRPRPNCGGVGQKASCPNGETAYCVLGTIRFHEPRPDAGPPVMLDAGPDVDGGAGDVDGGADTDAGAGPADAGAGPVDAGPAPTDAGP